MSRRTRLNHTNSKAIEKSRLQTRARPWRELLAGRCPAGWYRQVEQGTEAGHRPSNPPCSGRVAQAELVDDRGVLLKKKKKHTRPAAGPAPQPPPEQQHHHHHDRQPAARPAGASGGGSKVVQLHAPMSLARAREFLGLAPEEGGSGC